MTGRAGSAKGVAVGLKNFVKGRESEGGEGAGWREELVQRRELLRRLKNNFVKGRESEGGEGAGFTLAEG